MAEANTAEVEATVDAAFLGAGLSDPPPAPAAKGVDEPVVEPAKLDAAVPVVVPEKPRYVRLTEQDWNNTKAAAGKVATLESQVAKLVGSAPKAEQIVQQVLESVRSQTPAGLDVEMSDEDFAEMAADFPELAKSTRAALEKVLKKANVKGTGPAPSPAPPVDMDAAVEKVLLNREANALAEAHPDWSEIVGRPPAAGAPIDDANPFRQWLAKQPADYQKKVSETNSPAVVQAAIDRFRAAQTQPDSASPSPRPDRAAARRAVVADAVTPRADGNPPPLNAPQSADDAFSAGFRAVKKH